MRCFCARPFDVAEKLLIVTSKADLSIVVEAEVTDRARQLKVRCEGMCDETNELRAKLDALKRHCDGSKLLHDRTA